MKTVNKILVITLAIVLVFVSAIIMLLHRNIKTIALYGNGIPVEKSIQPGYFNKINVSGDIQVFFKQDSVSSVRIKADSNLINYVKVEVKDNELNISIADIMTRKSETKVSGISISRSVTLKSNIEIYCSAKDLKSIILNAGAEFSNSNPLNFNALYVEGNAGSEINMNGIFGKIEMNLNAGSSSLLKGSCAQLIFEGNAGVDLKAGEMEIKDCSLDVNAGSRVTVYTNGNLSVRGNAGSIIRYKGKPQIGEVELDGGASLGKE